MTKPFIGVSLALAVGAALSVGSTSTASAAGGAPAPAAAADDAPIFVIARYTDPAQVQAIGSRFQHLIVDRNKRTVRVEADADDIQALRQAGLAVEIDPVGTAKLRTFQAALRQGSGIKSIPGFACYRTVEETYQTMDALVAQAPQLARIDEIGPSWEKTQNAAEGHTMRALVLSNSATDAALPDKPEMVVLSSIHAREYTPAEVTTRFAQWLVDGYGTDAEATWLLDNFRFRLVLQGNPDGRKRAETGLSWRKNTNDSNGTCASSRLGVDLNRNFPFHWNTVPGGSSGDACQDTYRGPSAGSEPETRNLIGYIAGTRGSDGAFSGGVLPDRRGDALDSAAPDDYRGLYFDVHSAARLVLWPWGDTTQLAPNGTALQTLGRRLAGFNGYSPQQSVGLYATDGATDDNFYGSLGVPTYTLELGVAFFESCATFENTTLPDNLAMLRYAARTLHAPYQLPSGPDTSAVSASLATVAAGTPIMVDASIDDRGFNQSNGAEAVQAIASAAAYVDHAPWSPDAVAIPLAAVDGSFDAAQENVRGSIPTAGLALGPHLIYVQGTDAAGKPGTPNAVRITVGTSNNAVPSAAFTSTADGRTVTFRDTSTDSDGSVASRIWEFGDGATSTQANPVHAYAENGTYQVRLTVIDDDGASATVVTPVAALVADGVLQNGVPVADIAGSSQPRYYRIDVPQGATALTVATRGGSGDLDLYVRRGQLPTQAQADCTSENSDSTETCGGSGAPLQTQAGSYYVMLFPYSAFSGVTLTASYTGGPPPAPAGPTALQATATVHRPLKMVTLRWTGGAEKVDLYRDGIKWQTLPNAQVHRGRYLLPGPISFKVCNAGTDDCSEPVTP